MRTKKKTHLRRNAIVVLAAIAVICLILGFSGVGNKVAAAERTLTLLDLLNETNTYQANVITEDTSHDGYSNNQYIVTYNVNSSNHNTNIVAATPQITVLTHGYNSDAATWSNYIGVKPEVVNNQLTYQTKCIFAPTTESIIYKYYQKYGTKLRVVYAIVKDYNISDFYWLSNREVIPPYQLQDITAQTVYTFSNQTTPVEYTASGLSDGNYDFTDFDTDNHLLVVFETKNASESNNNVYFQFNYVLSRIAYNYKSKKDYLPKFNLIGHSRGGLTNLQYALDHPEMVANLISIGTPYDGSSSATVYHDFSNVDDDALRDITNQTVYNTYKNRWNNNYSLYADINATAIGAYSSLAFLSRACHEDVSGDLAGYGFTANQVDAALVGVAVAKVLLDCSLGFVNALGVRVLSAALEQCLSPNGVTAAINMFVNELFYDSSLISFANDVLVDLRSQVATGYIGFVRREHKYRLGDGTDFTKIAQYSVPVPHNLEPRTPQILDYVMEALTPQYDNSIYNCTLNSTHDGIIIQSVNNPNLLTRAGITNRLILPSTLVYEGVSYPVVEIGDYAFAEYFRTEFTNYNSVGIPGSVTKIGKSAFANCYNLNKIYTIGGSGVTLGEDAFYHCTSLNDINIKAVNLPARVFEGCTSLTSYSLYVNSTIGYIDEIGDGAFKGCTWLSSITNTNGLETIGDYAFKGCNHLTTLNLGNVDTIGSYAFDGCTAYTISLPYGLTTIRSGAFSNCTQLTSITIPASVTSLGSPDYGLETDPNYSYNLQVSNTLNNLINIFAGCNNLSSITVASGNTSYSVSDGVLYSADGETLLCYPKNKQNTIFALPNTLKHISAFSFMGNTYLTNVTLPSVFETLGIGAFYGCSNITGFTALCADPPSATIDSFFGLDTEEITVQVPCGALPEYENSVWSAFKVYETGMSITAQTVGGVTDYIFNSYTPPAGFDGDLTLPSWVNAISDEAFYGLTTLVSIDLPSSVVSIGDNAFDGCTSLEEVFIRNTVAPLTLGDDVFDNTSNDLTVYVPYLIYPAYANSSNWGDWLSQVVFAEFADEHVFEVAVCQQNASYTSTYNNDYNDVTIIALTDNYTGYGMLTDCYLEVSLIAIQSNYVVYNEDVGEHNCCLIAGYVIVPYYHIFGLDVTSFYLYPADSNITTSQIQQIIYVAVYRESVIR